MAESRTSEPGADIVRLHERRLLARHCAGDEAAFAELLGTLGPAVYGYLRRRGFSGAELDDLYQEVFWRVHRSAARYQPDCPLRPWVFTIAINVARDHVRRRRVQAVLAGDRLPESADPRPGPGAVVEAKQSADFLTAEIARLPEPWRDAVDLICLQRLDQRAAADLLGVPVNTVKTWLRRGRLALAQSLARRDQGVHREASR